MTIAFFISCCQAFLEGGSLLGFAPLKDWMTGHGIEGPTTSVSARDKWAHRQCQTLAKGASNDWIHISQQGTQHGITLNTCVQRILLLNSPERGNLIVTNVDSDFLGPHGQESRVEPDNLKSGVGCVILLVEII